MIHNKTILFLFIYLIPIINITSQKLYLVSDNFIYNEKYITDKQGKDILKENPDAYHYYTKMLSMELRNYDLGFAINANGAGITYTF